MESFIFDVVEYFRKISLTICLQKTRKGRDSSPLSFLIWYNTLAPWRTTSTKWEPPLFLHLDTSPVIGHTLVHSVDNTHGLVVTVDLIWLLFLNIFYSNFVATPIKFIRFTRFIRSYVNHLVSKLNCFFAWCVLFKVVMIYFFQLFVPNDSAFALLSVPIALML